MYRLTNFLQWEGACDEYGDQEGVRAFLRQSQCDGVELIYGGGDPNGVLPRETAVGYHLMFYSDWLDFWLEDEKTLDQKFGPGVWRTFFQGERREALFTQFRADLDRAAALGAQYVVFHVSDVSIEETYSYRWTHTHEQVIDAAAELINLLLDGQDYAFEFLMENLWWPGFTFTDPRLTGRLLDRVHSPQKGILLDTGHLLCTNRSIKTEEEGCRYIHQMLDAHGALSGYIRGMHLHQSVSGAYVEHSFLAQPILKADYYERFAQAYEHIYQIDRHEPVTSGAFRGVVERISPEYLVHELSAKTKSQKARLLAIQNKTLMG